MRFENTEVFGFAGAIRGMRNPLESWDKSDSYTEKDYLDGCEVRIGYKIGEKDLELMQKLIRAGTEHRKFMRQIFVSVDITAPLYWWKEFDTYKVGTVANSTSTMHKLASTPITMDCFEMDNYVNVPCFQNDDYWGTTDIWKQTINVLETLRQKYNETKDKIYWKELIRLLPESWLQTRTVTMNYENILSMVHQRKNHKLNEWSGKDKEDVPSFIGWVSSLPYSKELLLNE